MTVAALPDTLFAVGVVTGGVGVGFYWLLVYRLVRRKVDVKILAWPRDVRRVFVEYAAAARSGDLSTWPMYIAGVFLTATVALMITTMIIVSLSNASRRPSGW